MTTPHPAETLLRELLDAERETQRLLREQSRLLEALVDHLPVLQRVAHDLEGTAPLRRRRERIGRGIRAAARQIEAERKAKRQGAA